MKSKPIAVLISDIHYDLNTLEVADKAMRLAINKANDLNVSLIVAGDLHNTKANMRAECVNAMLQTFGSSGYNQVKILVGNHDKIHEKSGEHSLHFLKMQNVQIYDYPEYVELAKGAHVWLVPYHSDPEELKAFLKEVPKGSTLIMHQGLKSSASGDYIQDHSAITKDDVAGLRVISGHYHTRQTSELPDEGKWDYIGNPYTLGFGEANDPPKGFQILHSDQSLTFVPTDLRKHVIFEVTLDAKCAYYPYKDIKDDDIVWVKVKGTRLETVTKNSIRNTIKGVNVPEDFRLDIIPDEIELTEISETHKTPYELLNLHIDNQSIDEAKKGRLKSLIEELK